MGFQIIFVTLSVVCLGYSFTITDTKDAEYAEAIAYQDVEISSSATDCYIKAALEGCKKGKELNTTLLRETSDKKDMEEFSFTTVVKSTSAACLKAKCINNALSHKVEIGGDGEIAKPDILEKGYSNIYDSEAECMRSESVGVKITCRQTKLETPEYGVIEDTDAMRAPADMSQDPLLKPETIWAEDDSSNADDNEDHDEDSNNTAAAELEEYFKENVEAMEKDPGRGVTAKIQFNNWFRSCLNIQCPNRYAIYHALSGFSTHYLDRIWRFSCKLASDYNYNHCYWTGYMNVYDWPLMAMCNANYVQKGLYAIYSGSHRDRKFKLLCCRAHQHTTRSCQLTGHINSWRGWMNYGIGGHHRVFTGMFSYHHNGVQDRMWKILHCAYLR